MAQFEYKIASGFDVDDSSMDYFEDIFTGQQRKKSGSPLPRGSRVPLGSDTRIMLDGSRRTDGARIASITYDTVSFTDLDTYVTTYIGSWTTEYAAVTVKLQDPDGTFTRYNAYAYLPVSDGEINYQHINTSWVARLSLVFYIIGAV